MVRRFLFCALIVAACTSSPLWAAGTADITLGDYKLLPNTPGQTIAIYVTGGAAVSGVNFNLQVGDGGPALGGTPGPTISGVDLVTNTIFQSDNSGPLDLGSLSQINTEYLLTANNGDYVTADGLLATATIDTTGFFYGDSFPLLVAGTHNGTTNFTDSPVAGTMTNGLIEIVPEPCTGLLFAAGTLPLAIVALSRKRKAR